MFDDDTQGVVTYIDTHTQKDFEEQWQCALRDKERIISESPSRKDVMDLFHTDRFKETYNQLAVQLFERFDISKGDFLIQAQPTPRIFKPGSHGTSWHTDYWYGHGEKFYTAWVPLQGSIPGATFETLQRREDNDKIIKHYENNPELLQKEFDLAGCKTSAVVPKNGQIAAFGSTVLHASLRNTTETTRISFDFRFGPAGDKTITKDYNNYLELGENYKLKSRICGHRSFLKYIRGGQNISTTSQHILLESCCEANQIEIAAQEAEIERYGQPMFVKHITNIIRGDSKFTGIAVCCKSLIDDENMELALRNKVPIYFALENCFLK